MPHFVQRNLQIVAIFAGVTLLAYLTGRLVAYNGKMMVLIAIGFAIILPVCAQILRRWRFGVLIIVWWFVVVDQIRKFLGGSQKLLMAGDALLFFVLCVFFLTYYVFNKKSVFSYVPVNIRLLLVSFGCIVCVQAFNLRIPAWILPIAGIRTYLFYMLVLGLGVMFFRTEADLKRFYRWLLILSVPVILFSFCQGFLLYTNPSEVPEYLRSLAKEFHSFGHFEVQYVSASFASAKRYGKFLFVVYPWIYGLSVYLGVSRIRRWGLVLLFMTGNIISGSKEAVVMFLLFHMFFWVMTKERAMRYAAAFLIFLCIALAWHTILDFKFSDITAQNYRMRAILSDKSDWRKRVSQLVGGGGVNVAKAILGDQVLFFGKGAGTYGQEARLFDDMPIGTEIEAGDSGITKVLIELGIFGLFLFTVMYCYILRFLWLSLKKLALHRVYPVALAASFVPMGWIILFIKGHGTISDGMVSFGLWFSIGFILALRYYAVTGSFPVANQRGGR